jgi:hypothetical protein
MKGRRREGENTMSMKLRNVWNFKKREYYAGKSVETRERDAATTFISHFVLSCTVCACVRACVYTDTENGSKKSGSASWNSEVLC